MFTTSGNVQLRSAAKWCIVSYYMGEKGEFSWEIIVSTKSRPYINFSASVLVAVIKTRIKILKSLMFFNETAFIYLKYHVTYSSEREEKLKCGNLFALFNAKVYPYIIILLSITLSILSNNEHLLI